MKKWAGLLALTVFCAACGGAQPVADNASDTTAATADTTGTSGVIEKAKAAVGLPQYREVTIPSGTPLRLELQSAIGSDTSSIEDTVRASLRSPVSINGREVVPAGADVVGHVTGVERSGRVKGRAHIAYRFDQIQVGGDRVDMTTAPISHQAEATKAKDATKIGVGAGIGAAIGGLLGGGDGAAKGAAIGGAGGTGVVLATRGKEVRLGPGADVNTRLTAPLTLRLRVS